MLSAGDLAGEIDNNKAVLEEISGTKVRVVQCALRIFCSATPTADNLPPASPVVLDMKQYSSPRDGPTLSQTRHSHFDRISIKAEY